MACRGSFPFCRVENDTDNDPDPDKLVWSMCCREDVTASTFLHPFCGFHP